MSPHRAVGNMTPEKCFSGKKHVVSHFRIFGSLTYSYVPLEKRTKLEPTAEKGIFVGYDETAKAFRIYLPSQRKVVVRRDVKFEEERAFKNSRELEQGVQQVPAPQFVAQVPSMQQSGSQVFGVRGPQSVGTGSSSGTGDGSTITGTPYRGPRSGLQGTLGVGTPASGSQDTGVSTSGRYPDDDRSM